MNLYTAKYEATRPSPQNIPVNIDSNFAVGIGLKLNGRQLSVDQTDILLEDADGTTLSADAVYNDYAVFNLSSNSDTGYETYKVSTKQEGVNSEYVSVSAYITKEEYNAAGRVLTVDLEPLAGKTFYPVLTMQPTSTADYSKWKLCALNVNSSGKSIYLQATYIYDKATNNIIAEIGHYSTSGFSPEIRQKWRVRNADNTAWVEVQSYTVPANCYAKINYYVTSTTVAIRYFTDYQGKLHGQYKLNIMKQDNSKIEGYLDATSVAEDIFANTVTLSGTLSDDTTFSYELPYKAD